MKLVPEGMINNESALFQKVAWQRTGSEAYILDNADQMSDIKKHHSELNWNGDGLR